MSIVMATDIRQPIGWLFSALGVILVGYGLYTHGNPMYGTSEGVNINLWWGVVILVFGLLLLWLARRGVTKHISAAEENRRAREASVPPPGGR
jgi:hypothetical protein